MLTFHGPAAEVPAQTAKADMPTQPPQAMSEDIVKMLYEKIASLEARLADKNTANAAPPPQTPARRVRQKSSRSNAAASEPPSEDESMAEGDIDDSNIAVSPDGTIDARAFKLCFFKFLYIDPPI